MEKFYAVIEWSAYDDLQSRSCSAVYQNKQEAIGACKRCHDAVLEFDNQKDAEDYVNAFEGLLVGAWTPNQTPEDQEYYGEILTQATDEMDRLDHLCKRIH